MGLKLLIALTALAALVSIIIAAPRDEIENEDVDPSCMGETLVYSEKLNTTTPNCWDKLNPNESLREFLRERVTSGNQWEIGIRLACSDLCELQEFKVITADYKYDSSQLKNYVDQFNFPEKAIAGILKGWDACFTSPEASHVEMKGTNCSSITPVYDCLGTAYDEVCLVEKKNITLF